MTYRIEYISILQKLEKIINGYEGKEGRKVHCSRESSVRTLRARLVFAGRYRLSRQAITQVSTWYKGASGSFSCAIGGLYCIGDYVADKQLQVR